MNNLKSKISNLYWSTIRYAAEGLTGGLRDTFLSNARIFALVCNLDPEKTQ